MPHYTRTESDATWTTGNYAPTRADFESLDNKVFGSINGDAGGTWSLAADVNLTGAFGLSVTGPLVIGTGGTLRTTGSTPIGVPGSSYPALASGHALSSRTLVTSCGLGWAPPGLAQLAGLSNWGTLGAMRAYWTWSSTYQTWQSNAVTFTPAGNTSSPFTAPDNRPAFSPELVIPLRVHDGATLSTVTLTFRVPTPRTSAPGTLPKLRILRRDAAGNAVPLAATSDGTGFVSPASPASGAAWYANGQAQSFVYTCTQNNVIDVSQYTYEAHIVEEGGATSYPLAVRIIDPVLVASDSNTTQTGLLTVDGVTLASGDRVLSFGQTSLAQNGTYFTAGSGTWTTDPCMNGEPFIAFGMIVPVLMGSKYGSHAFQLVTPRPANGYSVGTTPLSFSSGPTPYGNVYHALACAFTNITSLRPQ